MSPQPGTQYPSTPAPDPVKMRYRGPIKRLRGETAIAFIVKRWVFVQFDNFGLVHGHKLLSHGMHKFKKKHWSLV